MIGRTIVLAIVAVSVTMATPSDGNARKKTKTPIEMCQDECNENYHDHLDSCDRGKVKDRDWCEANAEKNATACHNDCRTKYL